MKSIFISALSLLYGILLLPVFVSSCNGQQKTEQARSIASQYQWTKLADSAIFSKSYNFQLFTIRDTVWTFHPQGNHYSVNGKEWVISELPNSINNLAFLDYVYFNNAIYGLGHFEGNIETFTFRPEIYISTGLRSWHIISTGSNLPARFFYHPFVFDNKIWFAGGMDKNRTYADLWNSSDGIFWTKVKDNLPFGNRDNSLVVSFKNRLYLLNNDVWSSSNAVDWVKETDEIVKGVTVFGYAAVVFDNQIWLLGCNRNGQFSSKVLVSGDGKNWKEVDAPWSPRGGIAACVFRDKIIMTGGKFGGIDVSHPEFEYSNDIWTMEKITAPPQSGKPITTK